VLSEVKHLIEIIGSHRMRRASGEMFHGACPEHIEGFNMTTIYIDAIVVVARRCQDEH
jgi:hypothetical protein